MNMNPVKVIDLTRIFTLPTHVSISNFPGTPAGFLTKLYYEYFKKGNRITIKALDRINLTLRRGEILCLLGPNGSGKTTLLKIIAGLLLPTSGKVLIDGIDILNLTCEEIARRVTYIPGLLLGGAWINGFFTLKENLRNYAELLNLDKGRIEWALEITGLSEIKNVKAAALSSGIHARLVLASGLLKESGIYLMDEPMTGLSREIVVDLLGYIKNLRKAGSSILYATNSIEEAERIADRVAILNKGRIMAIGTPEELVEKIKEEIVEIEVEGINIGVFRENIERALPGESKVRIEPLNYTNDLLKAYLTTKDSRELLPPLIDRVVKSGGKVRFVKVHKPTLEEVFIKFTKLSGGGNERKD